MHLRAQIALCRFVIALNRFRMYQSNFSHLSPFIRTEYSGIDQLTMQIIYKLDFLRMLIDSERHVISKLRKEIMSSDQLMPIYD